MTSISKKKELLDNLLKTDIVNTVMELVKTEQTVTMEEVARRCGVAKGTLYNYFDSKDSLLAHVHNVVIAPIMASNMHIFSDEGPVLDRLRDLINAIFSINDDVYSYFVFMQQIRTAADELEERFKIAIVPMAKLCEDGIKEGVLPDADPYILAEMIFGVLIAPLKSLRFRKDYQPDYEKMKADIFKILGRIIIKERDKNEN